MLTETTNLRTESLDNLKSVIAQERASAVDALRGIESSANRLLGSGQEMLSHPLHSITSIVEPRDLVTPHPWRAIALATAAGTAVGFLLLRRASRRDSDFSKITRPIDNSWSGSPLPGPTRVERGTSPLGRILMRELGGLGQLALENFMGHLKKSLAKSLRPGS